MKDFTIIGKTDWRNSNQLFGIKDQDRFAHIYCIGKSGVGKSTLLLNMAISDIRRGNGICILDPHADLAETVLKYIPKERYEDVIYFDAADQNYCIAFNPLHDIEQKDFDIVAANLITTFKKVWGDSWGPRLEYILRYCLLSLLYHPKATLLHIHQLLTDTYFRNHVLMHVSDPGVLNFWRNEFDKYPPQLRAEAIAPILNKMGTLIASESLRNVLGQQRRSFSITQVMNSRKILICNLAKGAIGEDTASLLGAILLTAIQHAALGRANQAEDERVPYYVYVDEMHSFVSQAFCSALAECRKYKLSLFLTHQYIDQLHDDIRKAIFGNVGTLISFRVGAADAEVLEQEFYPTFKQEDLVNLQKYAVYLKLMIDGATSKPFSAVTLELPKQNVDVRKLIIQTSREKYCRAKSQVAEEISKALTYHRAGEQTLFSSDG